MILTQVIISKTPPVNNRFLWLEVTDTGKFNLKAYGPNGWKEVTEAVKGEKGDTGLKGDKGVAGNSITSITFTKDDTGNIISGVATLSDNSTINITIQ